MGCCWKNKEQCSVWLQYQPRVCHLSISQWEKPSQHLQGNASWWLWRVQLLPLSRYLHMPLPGFWKPKKSWLEGGQFFEWAPLPLLSSSPPPPPPTGARLLLRLVRAAATLGSWLPQVSHKASAAITIWSPLSCDFPLLLPSSWKALARSKTLTKKGQYLDWHQEGGVASVFPWECWTWIPAFPRGGEATQNTTATYFFQTAPARLFWDDQKADRSRYRHPLCPKCPNLLG